jgi:hypothetical protein
MLESIVAVQQEVETELFEFTKQMMSQHGYKRFSGLGHWVTIEMPGLKEALIQAGLVTERESAPFVFGFDSTPHCFRVQIWIYKKATLYSMTKGRLPHFSPERPEASRLVEVIFQRTIISSEKIIQESLSGLKQIIAEYFRSELNTDLAEASRRIGAWANTIQTPNNKGCIAAQPATTPLVEQARRKRGR